MDWVTEVPAGRVEPVSNLKGQLLESLRKRQVMKQE